MRGARASGCGCVSVRCVCGWVNGGLFVCLFD